MHVSSADDTGMPGAGLDGVPMVAAAVPIALHERRRAYEAADVRDDETPRPPYSVATSRPYTPIWNEYGDIQDRLPISAWAVLTCLVFRAMRQHRDYARLSFAEIARGANISRNTAISALDLLRELHLVTSDADERSRTQIRTYTLHPVDGTALVRLPELLKGRRSSGRTTSPTIALVTEASPTTALVQSPTSAMVDTTSAMVGHMIKKVKKREKKADVAYATGATRAHAPSAPAPGADARTESPPSRDSTDSALSEPAIVAPDVVPTVPPGARSAPAKPPRRARPRQLNDAQLAAKRPDDEYRASLIRAVEGVTGHKPVAPGKEWKAAGWFRTQPPNAPAPVEDVAAFYAVERRDPRWVTEDPSLAALTGKYLVWQRGRAGYQRNVELRCKRVEAVDHRPGTGDRAVPTVPPRTRTPLPAASDDWANEYRDQERG